MASFLNISEYIGVRPRSHGITASIADEAAGNYGESVLFIPRRESC
jgi:hypothetical protein